MKILSLFALVFTIPGYASDFHSPRTASLGGAGHAGPLLNDSIYLNPSYNSFLPTYAFAFSYGSFTGEPHQVGPNQSIDYYGRNYNASVSDGRSELFQAGVGYTMREDAYLINIGASKAVIRQAGVGMGAKLAFSHDESKPSVKDLTFSSTYVFTKWLQAALIVDNVLESKSALEWEMYREFILGTKVIALESIMLYLDPHYVPALGSKEKWGYEAGLEVTIMRDFFVRGGHFKNAAIPFQQGLRGQGYGFGAGWLAPRISLDYGFQKVAKNIRGLPSAYQHLFGATIYF